jgi:hypothetical protein
MSTFLVPDLVEISVRISPTSSPEVGGGKFDVAGVE